MREAPWNAAARRRLGMPELGKWHGAKASKAVAGATALQGSPAVSKKTIGDSSLTSRRLLQLI